MPADMQAVSSSSTALSAVPEVCPRDALSQHIPWPSDACVMCAGGKGSCRRGGRRGAQKEKEEGRAVF